MKTEESLVNRACEHFLELMISESNPLGSKEILRKLILAYSEPHRGYHTLEHIVSMLDEFEDVSIFVTDSNAVRFAIWYHDVIYDVNGDTSGLSNEEKSALRAEIDLRKLDIPTKRVESACQMIRATSHQGGVKVLSQDEQFLLDLDLAILGKDRDTFTRYTSGSRYEYYSVPDEIYEFERKKILTKFFERDPLYQTSFFRDKYEESAKLNLSRVLNKPYKPTAN